MSAMAQCRGVDTSIQCSRRFTLAVKKPSIGRAQEDRQNCCGVMSMIFSKNMLADRRALNHNVSILLQSMVWK